MKKKKRNLIEYTCLCDAICRVTAKCFHWHCRPCRIKGKLMIIYIYKYIYIYINMYITCRSIDSPQPLRSVLFKCCQIHVIAFTFSSSCCVSYSLHIATLYKGSFLFVSRTTLSYFNHRPVTYCLRFLYSLSFYGEEPSTIF